MRKKIKKYGGSLVIVFDKEDIELYGLREGDWVDIEDMLVQENKRVSLEDSSHKQKSSNAKRG